jgi:hypothetical protein
METGAVVVLESNDSTVYCTAKYPLAFTQELSEAGAAVILRYEEAWKLARQAASFLLKKVLAPGR